MLAGGVAFCGSSSGWSSNLGVQEEVDVRQNDMQSFLGKDGLEKFLLTLKSMAGVKPVDELYTAVYYYLMSFRQQAVESVREYLDREEKAWDDMKQILVAMRPLDATETVDPVPFHDQLRAILLLKRSSIQPRD